MNISSLEPGSWWARVPACLLLAWGATGCGSIPTPQHKVYAFPKEAFYGDVKRQYTTLGVVKTKVNYPSLDPVNEESDLCVNYFNKAVRDLVKRARDNGGDAVIDVKSVVFNEDGRQETFPRAECADDGAEGQALAQGIAVKWAGLSPAETTRQEARMRRNAIAEKAGFKPAAPEPKPEVEHRSKKKAATREAEPEADAQPETQRQPEPEPGPLAKPYRGALPSSPLSGPVIR